MTDGTETGDGSAGPPPVAATHVERIDDRLGLAVCRVGVAARTLVTYARDHVTVRTPSQPTVEDVNTLDLEAAPEPDDLEGWVDRFRETIGVLGVPHVQLRWEAEVAADRAAGVPELDPYLAASAGSLGLRLFPRMVLLLDELVEPPRALGDMVPVAPPAGAPGGAVDRRWHGARVLYRYLEGEDPDDWRAADQEAIAWRVEVQREMSLAERCQVWLTLRHGGPVARLHVVHDQQGLAAVEDIVVHPVVRRNGIAAALVHRAVHTHLEVHAGSRVGIVVEPDSSADGIARRLGFRPHAVVWTARREAGSGE